MDERSDQINQQIAETRSELGANLQELEHKVKDATDWRKQFQNNPLTMIGLAFGGGILLSRVVRGRSRSTHRYRSPEGWDSGAEANSGRSADAGTRQKKSVDMWDNIKGALVGVAATQASRLLRSAIPGFVEEYSKVEQRRAPAAQVPTSTPLSM